MTGAKCGSADMFPSAKITSDYERGVLWCRIHVYKAILFSSSLTFMPYSWQSCFKKKKKMFQTCVNQLEKEVVNVGKLISSNNRAHNCRNEIKNDPLCLVIMSVYGGVYSSVSDYNTENKMRVDIKYELEKLAAASISTKLLATSCGRQGSGW